VKFQKILSLTEVLVINLRNSFFFFFFSFNYMQDLEQGLGGRTPTEEAIDTLIKSYKSSEAHQEVRRQVAEICKKVMKQAINFMV
jgi:hypothetical protein